MICRNPKFQKTFEIAVISMKFFIWTKNQSHKMKPLKKLPIKRWMIWRKFMRMPLSHWKVFTNIAIWVTVTLAIRKSFRSHWLYSWDHGAVANLLSSIIWLAMNLRTFHLKLVCKINPSTFRILLWYFDGFFRSGTIIAILQHPHPRWNWRSVGRNAIICWLDIFGSSKVWTRFNWSLAWSQIAKQTFGKGKSKNLI